MFFRVKRVGGHQYLQLVENRRVRGAVRQCVLASLGRVDQLSAGGAAEAVQSSRDDLRRVAVAKAIAAAFSQGSRESPCRTKGIQGKARSNVTSQTA